MYTKLGLSYCNSPFLFVFLPKRCLSHIPVHTNTQWYIMADVMPTLWCCPVSDGRIVVTLSGICAYREELPSGTAISSTLHEPKQRHCYAERATR